MPALGSWSGVDVAALAWVHYAVYPRVAASWFDAHVVAAARDAGDRGDWERFDRVARRCYPLEREYYHMHFGRPRDR